MDLQANLILTEHDQKFADPKRIALLKAIASTGSIRQGAKQTQMSYKSAYDALQNMKAIANEELLNSETGGKGGGGAKLTPFSERLIKLYQILNTVQNMGLIALNDPSIPLDSLLDAMSRFSLQTSARNQLRGKIHAITAHGLNHHIEITLGHGILIFAIITQASSHKMQLMVGKEVIALIKAPTIHLSEAPINISDESQRKYQNQLIAHIQEIEQSNGQTNVTLRLNNDICLYGQSHLSINALPLNQKIHVQFSADQVILASLV